MNGMNGRALRQAMKEKGIGVEELAKRVQLKKRTLYHKIRGDTEFRRSEIQEICEVLGLDTPMGIFF